MRVARAEGLVGLDARGRAGVRGGRIAQNVAAAVRVVGHAAECSGGFEDRGKELSLHRNSPCEKRFSARVAMKAMPSSPLYR